MSGLVGDSHQAALRTLIDTYERVGAKVAAEAAGPADSELVVLSAPMGWGKTRVVQEFYAHLASQQPADTPYWPSELVADVDRGPALKARKRVEPGTFEVSNSTNMPFLWWGVSCQERQDARLSNAVGDDIGQLVAHFGPALNKLEANKATRNAALGLARTLMAAAPFSDVPGILDGLDNFRTNIRDLFRAQRDRQRGDTHRIDPSENDGSLIETWVGAIGSLLRTARIPMVVILDDAHWADPSSIEFIDELLKRVPCLVVLTAWPDQLTIQEQTINLATLAVCSGVGGTGSLSVTSSDQATLLPWGSQPPLSGSKHLIRSPPNSLNGHTATRSCSGCGQNCPTCSQQRWLEQRWIPTTLLSCLRTLGPSSSDGGGTFPRSSKPCSLRPPNTEQTSFQPLSLRRSKRSILSTRPPVTRRLRMPLILIGGSVA